MALAERFWNYEELNEAQREARSHRRFFVNLSGKDLKPILRDKFRPVLKAAGFKRVNESFSIRQIEPHYVHYLRVMFSSTSAGRFCVTGGILLAFLPNTDGTAYQPKQKVDDGHLLLRKVLTLPNGNPEFDHGTNLTEATETVDLLISAFEQFDKEYFGMFRHFPEPLDKLGVPFAKKMREAVRANSETEYGHSGGTTSLFAYRLALVHQFLGHTQRCRELAEYALTDCHSKYLRPKYEALIQE